MLPNEYRGIKDKHVHKNGISLRATIHRDLDYTTSFEVSSHVVDNIALNAVNYHFMIGCFSDLLLKPRTCRARDMVSTSYFEVKDQRRYMHSR